MDWCACGGRHSRGWTFFLRGGVCAGAVADGAFHEYALDLAEHPDWKGDVDELWFEASQIMHARVAVDWMRFE